MPRRVINLLRLSSVVFFFSLFATQITNAATLLFSEFESTNTPLLVTPTFSVSDEPTGAFEVTVGIATESEETGLLSGIFFDLSDDLSKSDIVGTPTIAKFRNNTKKVGGGVNLNGKFSESGHAFIFDVGFRFTKTDISTPLTFTVSDLGGSLNLSDWTRVGLRFQSVTTNGVGTLQDDKLMGMPVVSAVPLPAALPLYGAGLIILGFLGYKRRARR